LGKKNHFIFFEKLQKATTLFFDLQSGRRTDGQSINRFCVEGKYSNEGSKNLLGRKEDIGARKARGIFDLSFDNGTIIIVFFTSPLQSGKRLTPSPLAGSHYQKGNPFLN